jgi:hypothetical protein
MIRFASPLWRIAVTEQAKWPVKRPLAFAIQTHKGNWILYNDEEIAAKVADEKGLDYHGTNCSRRWKQWYAVLNTMHPASI